MSNVTDLKNLEQRIADKVDPDATKTMQISSADGGAQFRAMSEVMEFAKLMALGGVALPSFLRGNVGACLAICIQAIEWRMSPYAVANKAYVVNDRVAYESQLIHAVIEQRAPLTGRLRHSFAGSGEARTCTVVGCLAGEPEPLSYTSPEIGKITPKNSPLWKTKPDLQLYYNASRDWARMYFPDVILGVYSDDEISIAHAGEIARSASTVVVLEAESTPPAKSLDEVAKTLAAKKEPKPKAEPKPAAKEPAALTQEQEFAWDAWADQLNSCERQAEVDAMGIPKSFTDAQETEALKLIAAKSKNVKGQ